MVIKKAGCPPEQVLGELIYLVFDYHEARDDVLKAPANEHG